MFSHLRHKLHIALYGHKNVGPFLAFSEDWFTSHQSKLLSFLNHRNKLIRRTARFVMRLRKNDYGFDKDLFEIKPNRYTVKNADGTFTTDFRTHPKYAKRLYYAFRPLWWTLHFWDWLVAERFYPALSFGFPTLTQRPDTGSGATSVDGPVGYYTGSPTTFQTTAFFNSQTNGTFANTTAANTIGVTTMMMGWCFARGVNGTRNYSNLRRAAFTFDTSSLSGATVSAADLRIYAQVGNSAVTMNYEATTVVVVSVNLTSVNNLVVGDFDQSKWGTTYLSATELSIPANSVYDAQSYRTFPLNATGLAALNLTGVSQFGLRLSKGDLDNTGPLITTSGSSASHRGMGGAFADTTGAANDPELVVTYTASGGGGNKNYTAAMIA